MKGRIVFLDYLRIFAFSSVLVGHKFQTQLAAMSTDPNVHVTLRHLAQALLPLTFGGGAGVVVFFLVSGYIIAHVLRTERAGTFLVKRIFRIYPLYFAALLLEGILLYYLIGESLPSLSEWIPRILLIGDFFGTPYSLGHVEWTLRIEILFYAFMAVCRLTVFQSRVNWLPLIFVAATVLLQLAGPFPNFAGWNDGYTTLYLPILFVGSNIYLLEKGLASRSSCLASIAWIVGTYLLASPQINRAGMESNFVVYALGLFALAWAFKTAIPDNLVVRFLSNMTYAVYLLHNWSWDFLGARVDAVGLRWMPRDAQIIIALLLVCAALHYTVERYGIKLGARLLEMARRRPRAHLEEGHVLRPVLEKEV